MSNHYNLRTDAASLWTTTCQHAEPGSSIRVSDLATPEMLAAIEPSSGTDDAVSFVPKTAAALDVDPQLPLWPYAFPRLKQAMVVDVPAEVASQMRPPSSITDALMQLVEQQRSPEVRTVDSEAQLDLPAVTVPLADDGRPFDSALSDALESAAFRGPAAAGLLLANGQDDASHHVSQASEGQQDFDYWHGLMHRREPDFGNAGYWFRRVGDHPLYHDLAARINRAFDVVGWTDGPSEWDAMAFLESCRAALRDGADRDRVLVQQQVEYAALLEYVANA